jgi:hypothetical protein
MILQDAEASRRELRLVSGDTPIFALRLHNAKLTRLQWGRENDVKWMRCPACPAIVLKHG